MIKTKATAILAASVIAGLIVLLEWAIPVVDDQFTVLSYQDTHYKIYRYGFPFAITDGNPILPQTTTQKEILLRLAGNFVFYSVPIALLLLGRASKHKEERPNQAL